MRKLPPVRHIRPEQICIGDVLKLVWTEGDIEYTRLATVATRNHWGRHTVYETAKGMEIVSANAGHTEPEGVKITLIDRKATNQPTLDGLDV